MQSSDFNWYKEHLEELFNEYGELYIAIKDKKVLGVYRSLREGVSETAKVEELGTFIVQKCGRDESAYTNYISSMDFSN